MRRYQKFVDKARGACYTCLLYTSNYLYSFTGGETQPPGDEARTTSPVSDAISRDLKRRGMRYMGSVTVYSYLQAVGVVNDHEPGCFLHRARKGG